MTIGKSYTKFCHKWKQRNGIVAVRRIQSRRFLLNLIQAKNKKLGMFEGNSPVENRRLMVDWSGGRFGETMFLGR